MMHGYGANWEDLFPLHSYLSPESDWNWYFPNAPLEVPLGIMMSGRAWFPIDMEALNEAMMSGSHRDFRKLSSDDFNLMLQRLEPIYNQILDEHKDVYIGGFSQGAMIASHLGFRLKRKLKGMILFSSNLIDEENLKKVISKYPETAYFQSHGTQDPLLGFSGAKALNELLSSQGHHGEFLEFRGEHSIPMEVISAAKSFLQKASSV